MKAGHRLAGVCLLLTAMAGCAAGNPPLFPPPANATIEGYAPFAADVDPASPPTADVVLVGQCGSCTEFGRTKDGNFEDVWYVVTFDVVTVERGAWPKTTVSFICFDSSPGGESGVRERKARWPYRREVQMRLWLDTKQQPARVVGQRFLFDLSAQTQAATQP